MIDVLNEKFVDIMKIVVDRVTVLTDDGVTTSCENAILYLDDSAPGMTIVSIDDPTVMKAFNMKHVVGYTIKVSSGKKDE